MLGVRLRNECGWSEGRILNISSRGLLVHAPDVQRRGAYIEVWKGQHRIIARVVWAREGCFGVRTQDRLAVDSFTMGIEPAILVADGETTERRRRPRPWNSAERHERSRRRSRAVEFACVAAFGCAAAFFTFDTVRATLSKPLGLVEAKLGARS